MPTEPLTIDLKMTHEEFTRAVEGLAAKHEPVTLEAIRQVVREEIEARLGRRPDPAEVAERIARSGRI